MISELQQLGLTEKEAHVYVALLEFGTQPASVIARKTQYPKTTVLFLCDNLCKRGYIRKSQRGRVQYFHADPAYLQSAKEKELEQAEKTLHKTIPLLREFKNPFTAEPKVTFFEGLENCKKAYELLLTSKTEILEFGAHEDLLKFGGDFMQRFIGQRMKKKLMLHAIASKNPIHEQLIKRNKKEFRTITLCPKKYGHIYSSIAVFDDKVLVLNLYTDAFALLIENKEVAETLRTIHAMARRTNPA